MAPYKEESYLNFAWRIRAAFYALPVQSQESPHVRDMLHEIMKMYMPRAWAQLLSRISILTNPELVEEVIVLAGNISRFEVENHIYTRPSVNVTLQGQASPYYQLQVGESTTTTPGKAEIVQPNAQTTQTGLTIVDPRKDNRAVHTTHEKYEE
ncbi:hypothetical protein K3495_g17421, partial [Podosphaera aphanis]